MIWKKQRKRGVFESDHCTMINKKTIFGQNLKALFRERALRWDETAL